MSGNKSASAEELDRRFDAGEDMADYFDLSSARRPGLETRRVNVDIPQWMIARLDAEAKRRDPPGADQDVACGPDRRGGISRSNPRRSGS